MQQTCMDMYIFRKGREKSTPSVKLSLTYIHKNTLFTGGHLREYKGVQDKGKF